MSIVIHMRERHRNRMQQPPVPARQARPDPVCTPQHASREDCFLCQDAAAAPLPGGTQLSMTSSAGATIACRSSMGNHRSAHP